MRQTIQELDEAAAFMEQIKSLSQPKRDHLHLTIKVLMKCYVDDKAHGVLLVDHEDVDRVEMLAINASEMEAAALLGLASVAMTNDLMSDMPDKGMLN